MPALRQRERREHADGVERDEVRRRSAPNTTVSSVASAASTMMPLANTRRRPRLVSGVGRKWSSRVEAGEAREVGERRVGREHQDQHRHRLDEEERDVAQRRRCRRWRGSIWLITVSLVLGIGCSFHARKEMPRNMTPSSTPSQASTRRAFFHSTGLNAGTPLEIASTPVIAVEPPANACSSRKMPSEPPAPAATSAWCDVDRDRDRP